MRRIGLLLVGPCVVLLPLAGCGKPCREATVRQVCAPGSQKLQLMQTAEDVLSDMQFAIEKADVDAGLIRTRPLAGAQFFEFWRSDNVGPGSTAEASIQTIRRTAELKIDQQNGQLCMSCTVTIHRLNMPEHEITSSGRAYTMFTKSSSSLQRITPNPDQRAGMQWTPLGQDESLAAEILRRIEARTAVPGKEEKT